MPAHLTKRQREVLEAIESYWHEHGISPSTGGLARELGISRATVHEHFLALKSKGYLEHQEGTSRSWRPVRGQPTCIPIVGRVAAGAPIFAQENIEGWIGIDAVPQGQRLFALRVQGDSMTGAGILEGDLVVVRQQDTADDGDIVVALLDDEDATVKKLRRDSGRLHLIAMNPKHEPLVVDPERVRIQGKVVSLRRDIEETHPEPGGSR